MSRRRRSPIAASPYQSTKECAQIHKQWVHLNKELVQLHRTNAMHSHSGHG